MKTATAHLRRAEYQRIGQAIRENRERQEMTQAQLSDHVRTLSPAAVSYIENGLRRLQITELKDIAKALGVSPSVLLGVSQVEMQVSREIGSIRNETTSLPTVISSDVSRVFNG